MRLALFASAIAFILSPAPALACKMVTKDGQTIVDPECSSLEYIASMDADGFASTSRFFERVCGAQKLSVYSSKRLDGSDGTVSIVTTNVGNAKIRHDYTHEIMALLTPSHDIHRTEGQCFDSDTQIGLHIPSEGGQALKFLLSDGRVLEGYDRRARQE